MVDNVCLYEARVDEVVRLHSLALNNSLQPEGTELAAGLALAESIAKIPLNPVPSGKKDCPEV